jgi:hypothetical protein
VLVFSKDVGEHSLTFENPSFCRLLRFMEGLSNCMERKRIVQ